MTPQISTPQGSVMMQCQVMCLHVLYNWPAGLKLPPLAKTCFSELIEDQGFNDSHIIDVPSSGKRKKMPKKKSQDALADAAGDSPSSLNGKKLVNQESEEKDSDQLVIWR